MKRTVLFVSGLEDSITEAVLQSAFIPFGPLKSVQLPRKDNKLRGFAFVEFAEEEDCLDAVENMDGSELMGRTLNCNIAKPNAGGKMKQGAAVWTAEDFLAAAADEGEEG